jgi:cell fate regulator YaaT (PSP1 superfamily)
MRLANPRSIWGGQNQQLKSGPWIFACCIVSLAPSTWCRWNTFSNTSKIIFYFTAPGRVDFRELVKDLVQEFRTRIELRQIGVRHRAKMVGGLGICGRGLCCASFLKDFEPVSVRMAKEQQLSLNPSKISGICGRLMCCLVYEYASYQEIRKSLPRVGKRIQIPEGEGKIIRYNLIRATVTLEMEDKRELELPLADLVELLAPEPAPEPEPESV